MYELHLETLGSQPIMLKILPRYCRIPCKNFPYLGKVTLVSIWWWDGIDPTINVGIERFSRLVMPTKYQY